MCKIQTTPFTWDDNSTPNLLSDGTHQFIYGPGGTPLEQITGTTVNFLLTDALGTIRAITNAAGAMVASFTYDAFGLLTAHTGTTTTPLGFTGAYQDIITGFNYLRARYYDPATAAFTSTDPAYQKTGQRYTYTNNNPLNQIDPLGLWGVWDTIGAIGLGIGIVALALTGVGAIAEVVGVAAAASAEVAEATVATAEIAETASAAAEAAEATASEGEDVASWTKTIRKIGTAGALTGEATDAAACWVGNDDLGCAGMYIGVVSLGFGAGALFSGAAEGYGAGWDIGGAMFGLGQAGVDAHTLWASCTHGK